MAEELRAQPDVLSHVGTQLANHGETLLAVQQACLGAAADAQSGWVGSSAGALSGLLDGWETAGTTHIGRFGEHSCGMHFAAVELTEMEQRTAAALAEVGTTADGDAARGV
ncbi:hypothetical protein OQ968_03230 [Mycobacterium sp. 663a-19]|uniref:hypothetical protein n=1 Tax=Mycobacterium sp. 663a-19 TaxID=2986148 RepID=UPI002D1F1825|nr:hypothetical protein [Mycobacterium sp. 663a-19]MEB3980272.1 hypothetical protein [Mycobacterium sp. 663a-19]